jgi:phage-related tail fiber protein
MLLHKHIKIVNLSSCTDNEYVGIDKLLLLKTKKYVDRSIKAKKAGLLFCYLTPLYVSLLLGSIERWRFGC